MDGWMISYKNIATSDPIHYAEIKMCDRAKLECDVNFIRKLQRQKKWKRHGFGAGAGVGACEVSCNNNDNVSLFAFLGNDYIPVNI